MTGSPYADPESSYRPTPWVVPAWLERTALLVACYAAGLSMVSWLAGLAGLLLLGPVLIFGLATGYTLYSLWGPITPPAAPATHRLGRIVLYVAIGCGVFCGVFATGRVLVDGAGAATTVTAKAATTQASPSATVWVSGDRGSLATADVSGVAIACGESCLAGAEGATVRSAESRLAPSFATLFAWAGTDVLFRFGSVMAGLAVILFFVMAQMWLRPSLALLVMVGAAASPLTVYAARSNHPAIVALLFASAGLWSLEQARRTDEAGKAIVGGFFCALAGAAFTPAFALLGGLAVYLGWREASITSEQWIERHRRRLAAARVAGGAAGPFALALADAVGRDAVGAVFAVMWPGLLVGGLLVLGRAVLARAHTAPSKNLIRMVPAFVAAALVVAAVVLVVRPPGAGPSSEAVAVAQRAEAIAVNPELTYQEQSLSWLIWYVGPVAVAMAVGGLALALARRRREWSIPLVVAGFATGTLLFDPGVVGVVPDAALVFLPFGLAALLLPAGLVLESWLSDQEWSFMEQVAVLAGAILVASPVWITARTWDHEPQPGAAAGVEAICAAAGDAPIRLVATATGRDAATLIAPAVNAFCDVETGLGEREVDPLEGATVIEFGERREPGDEPLDSSVVLRYDRLEPHVSTPPLQRAGDDYPWRVTG